jgi:hypothetical protein
LTRHDVAIGGESNEGLTGVIARSLVDKAGGAPVAWWARRRLGAMRRAAISAAAQVAQRRVLRRILVRAARTEFGRHFGLHPGLAFEDYAERVPLFAGYEPMADDWWRRAQFGEIDVCWPGRVKYWAQSSGTTRAVGAGGREKWIPVTRASIRSTVAGGMDALVPWLANGVLRPFRGRTLWLGGCTSLSRRSPGGAPVGDNTGIMARQMPWPARTLRAPSAAVAAIEDWGARRDAALARSMSQRLCAIAGVPTWVLSFAEAALERQRQAASPSSARARDASSIWPNLGLYLHGGVDFAPYRARARVLLGPGVVFADSYSATEGGMLAVQDEVVDDEDRAAENGEERFGLLPLVDRGAFFECVPLDHLDEHGVPSASAARVGLWDVETGQDYALALTTDQGLYSYLLGDVVRFRRHSATDGADSLRLVFVGRTAQSLNAFGEHLHGQQLASAASHAAAAAGVVLVEFAVHARVAGGDGGIRTNGGYRHEWFVECASSGHDSAWCGAFATAVDRCLCRLSADYEAVRRAGVQAPAVVAVARGGFDVFLRKRGTYGGQAKVPMVLDAVSAASLQLV